MSRAALLLVVGEAFNDKQKTLILDKIVEDLQSWNDNGARCDVEKELEEFAAEMHQSFGDVTVSGTALSHNSASLSIAILFSPDRKLLLDSLQNFLLLDSHYRHLVYSGQTIAGSGSWILPDDVFTFRNFVKVLKDMDSVGVGGDGKGFALNVSSGSEWDWSKGNFSRLSNLGVRQAAASEGLSEKGRSFSGFRAFLDSLVAVVDMKDLLPASSTVGMINFSGPTLYIFPGGNGSSALFGVKGFTGLIDGGYSRKSCSWHFSRHLHQIDMVILSHLGASNFLGMQSFLERKVETGSPDVGSVFFNCPEKFRKLSPNPESLKVNLFDAGAALSEKLTSVGLAPQPCFAPQPFQPITLYNKVGFGSVDMYVLNPVQSSEEMKSFLHQWSARAESDSFSAHSGVPLSNTLSVSVLLVWKPFSPTAKIVRVLFPGGTPQSKIFEGLDRMKNIPMFERCECSQAELAAKPTRAAQSRPTTLKATTAKVNGNVEQRETARGKPMNGSRDSMAGKARSDAREPPTLVKASVIQRATKVEPKKTIVTSPANGTASPKTDPKTTAKPTSPAKDVKPTSSRTVESLPPKRLAQKPSEAEASPKNKATKASQPEAVKQTKPARRTEEVKASETVKQAPASKPLSTAREPAARQPTSTRDSRAGRHSEPAKQPTKASLAAEAAKQATPKPIRAPTKEADKKLTKPVEPKKPTQPELEKKDVEKEVKEEVALIQPAEEVKQTETPVSEAVCVAAAVVEQASAPLPLEVGPIVAGVALGGDVEAGTRAVDYDLPSPEDVAQMSQEDEDSFVEELPTETEPTEGDHKVKDSVLAPAADLDLMGNHELPSDHDIHATHDLDSKVKNENEVEGNEDLVYGREIPRNVGSGEFGNDIDAASWEVVEGKVDAELEEDLEFERAEEAVQSLDDSIEDGNVESAQESAQVSYAQDPDVVARQDISGVGELETGKLLDDRKANDDLELLISHDDEGVAHRSTAVDHGSAHDQDVLDEKVAVAEGSDEEKEDFGNDRDLEEHVERKHYLESEHAQKDLFEDRDEDQDMEDDDLETERILQIEHDLQKERDLQEEHDLQKQLDLQNEHDLEKQLDLQEEYDLEKEHHLQKERDLEKERVENDLLVNHGRHEDHDSTKDHDLEKEPNSWLLQDSRSPMEQPSAFQTKRATDGLARYCEEFGSDEGEVGEDEGQRDDLKTDRVTCPGGIQVPDRKGDAEEEEDEVDELEAVEEEEEVEEDEEARFGAERKAVPEIGSEVDVVVLSEDAANGAHLPDVLACKRFVIEEDVELVKLVPTKCSAASAVPEVGQVVVEGRDEELVADEGLGKEDDFGGEEDFDVNEQHFGKADGGFGRVEQGLGRGDDFNKGGDFGRKDEAGFSSDDDLMKDEEAGKAAEERFAGMQGKDDDDSDVDLSESKEGLRAGEGSGGSISDNEAEEMEPGVTPLDATDDDVLPCALKKDTAIENLAAICAETKEESSETVASHSSRELMLGEARPDLVAACEAAEPRDVEPAVESEEEDRVSVEGPDVVEAEGADGFEAEQPQNLSVDEGISQGKPHDLFNREEEEEDQASSWRLENMAANLAHEVIQSSMAAQNLDAFGCFASGPVSVTTLNGTEKREFEEGLESTPETLNAVTNLVSAKVDTTVASSDRMTSSGRFNYGFDDERREDAFDADSFDAASAVVQPQFKSGEDSGESDLDEGQDACHQGQHGLELGHEPDDVSRLDEGFEESTGDEGTANVVELLPQRVEKEAAKLLTSRAEDSEGFAYGASGEVADEQEEPPFGSGGDPSSEKTADDSSRPLLDFDDAADVSAAHKMECGNGCVEAHQEAADHWRTNNLNPFLDPCSVDAKERGTLKEDLHDDGNRRHFHGMTASGEFSEDLDRKLEGDEQSIPSDDNAEPGMPTNHGQDLGYDRVSGDRRATPEDETAEIRRRVESESPDVTKSHAVTETSENRRTSSFWTYDDDNVQSTESTAVVRGAADNILFSEETTNDDAERDINENLGAVAPTGQLGADGEEEEEDMERVSTQSNASEEEGESRSSAVLSEQRDEGAESLDSDEAAELDPVKSWGQPMGLPAPMQDSNRSKVKTTTSRPSNDAANLTLPVSTQDKRPAAAKGGDRSFVAPQKKGSDVRKSGALKTTAETIESKENGSAKTTTATKKPVTSTAAAPVGKKQTATSSDSSKSKPLKHVVPFYVDLTYIPGNGDPSFVDADFFRRVRARYYVLSCLDPDPRFLACLVEGKQTWENKDLSVNVIPTHDSSALHRWFHENAKLVEELKISLLPAANKCTIKLQDKDDGCYAFRIEF